MSAGIGQSGAVRPWRPKREPNNLTAVPADSERTRANGQELFQEMLKVGMWPRLRAIGLSGSGTTIRLPCKDAHAMIGLQRSTSSTRDLVKFTANVSVTTKQRWAEMRMDASFLGEQPSPNSHPWGWGTRIGHLMPDHADTWWTIQTGDSWQPVAAAVLEAIETFALPRMRQELAARL